jgi:nucleotide-binding universal stress UspA family protein
MEKSGAQGFVVVGVDGSDVSVKALRWAVDYAKLREIQVVAVTGFDTPWHIYITPTVTGADYARMAQEKLDATVDALDEIGLNVERRVVQLHPAKALILAAQGADLLVVGSHGTGGFPGMNLGSVASHCVHHAPCPVVVVRDGLEPSGDVQAR